MSPGDRMAKGLDFMLKGIGPKDKTQETGDGAPESRVTTQESGEITPESRGTKEFKRQESRVIIPESESTASEAKDARHESGVGLPESGVMTHESGTLNQDSAALPRETRPRSRGEKRKSRSGTSESGLVTDDIINQAVSQAMKSPKISLYSPLLLAVLESQQLMLLDRKEMTLLQYRKATKARELVENALKESYPDLCEKILKRINESNGKS
jgi:hypothetical protein